MVKILVKQQKLPLKLALNLLDLPTKHVLLSKPEN
jgi:hypothetical protein